ASGTCIGRIGLDVYEQDPNLHLIGPVVSIEPEMGCPAIDALAYPALALLRQDLLIAIRHLPDPNASSTDYPYELGVSFVDASCADGVVDRGEECDAGNTPAGDGCNSNCELEDRDEPEPNESFGDVLEPNRLFRAFLNDDDFDLFSVTI